MVSLLQSPIHLEINRNCGYFPFQHCRDCPLQARHCNGPIYPNCNCSCKQFQNTNFLIMKLFNVCVKVCRTHALSWHKLQKKWLYIRPKRVLLCPSITLRPVVWDHPPWVLKGDGLRTCDQRPHF